MKNILLSAVMVMIFISCSNNQPRPSEVREIKNRNVPWRASRLADSTVTTIVNADSGYLPGDRVIINEVTFNLKQKVK
jgi:hypothetical protein